MKDKECLYVAKEGLKVYIYLYLYIIFINLNSVN